MDSRSSTVTRALKDLSESGYLSECSGAVGTYVLTPKGFALLSLWDDAAKEKKTHSTIDE